MEDGATRIVHRAADRDCLRICERKMEKKGSAELKFPGDRHFSFIDFQVYALEGRKHGTQKKYQDSRSGGSCGLGGGGANDNYAILIPALQSRIRSRENNA